MTGDTARGMGSPDELRPARVGEQVQGGVAGPGGVVGAGGRGVTGFAGPVFLEVWVAGAGVVRWERDGPGMAGGLGPVTVPEIIRDLREVRL
ncbi:hypothetical protein [Dactylosporangium sp. NPDC050588]|uniref:hypothetical protein n=1 Tax=Dactylosporangium sp. NPDC050588 TaxID=3157211 RepID=UPI0033D5E0BE